VWVYSKWVGSNPSFSRASVHSFALNGSIIATTPLSLSMNAVFMFIRVPIWVTQTSTPSSQTETWNSPSLSTITRSGNRRIGVAALLSRGRLQSVASESRHVARMPSTHTLLGGLAPGLLLRLGV